MWEASKCLDLEAEPPPAPHHVPLQTSRRGVVGSELSRGSWEGVSLYSRSSTKIWDQEHPPKTGDRPLTFLSWLSRLWLPFWNLWMHWFDSAEGRVRRRPEKLETERKPSICPAQDTILLGMAGCGGFPSCPPSSRNLRAWHSWLHHLGRVLGGKYRNLRPGWPARQGCPSLCGAPCGGLCP